MERMDFTFGIITDGSNDRYIRTIVKQIQDEKIPNYEIIIVGKTEVCGPDIINITFDGSESSNLPKKKNMICHLAKYDIIVLLHDYVGFERGWYNGYLKYGAEFDLCINPIQNYDGYRFRDFLLFYATGEPPLKNRYLLPYGYLPNSSVNKFIYISGAYYVIKKKLALQIPLDERLLHNMGEDVIFSQQCIEQGVRILCNPYSTNCLLKQKDILPKPEEVDPDMLEYLSELSDEASTRIFLRNKQYMKEWLKIIYNTDL